MVYGDTSVLVALIVNESGSAAAAKWYASTRPNRSAKRGAGDTLHLACVEQAQVKSVATSDAVMTRNAQLLKIKPVQFQAAAAVVK